MADVRELRVALTVEDFDGALKTPWGDPNARVRAPDGTQLTLFTLE
jgi:hypothetical protein